MNYGTMKPYDLARVIVKGEARIAEYAGKKMKGGITRTKGVVANCLWLLSATVGADLATELLIEAREAHTC